VFKFMHGIAPEHIVRTRAIARSRVLILEGTVVTDNFDSKSRILPTSDPRVNCDTFRGFFARD